MLAHITIRLIADTAGEIKTPVGMYKEFYVSPNSFFIRLISASISLCAWCTFRYHGTVIWQSI